MSQPRVTMTMAGTITNMRPRSTRSMRGSWGSMGWRLISSPSAGSMMRFTVMSPSVTRLFHKIWTAANGGGSPTIRAANSTATSANAVDNSSRVAFLMLR